MNTKILTGFLIVLSGCLSNNKQVTDTILSDSSSAEIEYSPPIQFIEDVIIPAGFSEDSIVYVDRAHNISYFMEIPISSFPAFQEFLEARVDMITKVMSERAEKRNLEIKEVVTDDTILLGIELSRMKSFDLYPQFVYQDPTCISMRFCSTWYEGGAHGLPEYYVINFDKQTGSEINFNDFFQLTSVQDSQLFVDLINEGLQNPQLSIIEAYPVKFNIEGDSISFNFDAYELESYAFGMPRAYVTKSELGSLINEKYR